VNYKKQFAHSVNRDEVVALYAAAGLDLEADLDTLNDAPRIGAHPVSVEYLEQNIIFDGDIRVPVLTLHTTGDGLVSNQNENAYADVVREAGNNRFLRRTFVHRAGHCPLTPAETVTALINLIVRLDTGIWPDLTPDALNAEAGALGPLNIAPPSFIEFAPAQFLRPFEGGLGRGFRSLPNLPGETATVRRGLGRERAPSPRALRHDHQARAPRHTA
jgi:hypothetical protein